MEVFVDHFFTLLLVDTESPNCPKCEKGKLYDHAKTIETTHGRDIHYFFKCHDCGYTVNMEN